MSSLQQLLEFSANKWPNNIAVVAPSGAQMTYSELDKLSDRVRDHLVASGVSSGDRVGLFMRKSIDTIAVIFGVLKAGAAYVPVDVSAPTTRGAYILNNCAVSAYFVESSAHGSMSEDLSALGFSPDTYVIDDPDDGSSLNACLDKMGAVNPASTVNSSEDSTAYILYTSGSTGKPKGVVISQLNATSFVDWCTAVLEPRDDDRFSSHAPFHFDLSILDIFVSLKHGAALVLIDEWISKRPSELAAWIEEQAITVWYSAPSILTMLAQHGELEKRNHQSIRIVCFAGEVFPINHLRTIKTLWPGKSYFNLYGPTETNVCTWHPIPDVIPDDLTKPYPIGKVCEHLRGIVVDTEENEVEPGAEGELCIAGPSVLQKYWNLEEQTNNAFLTSRDDDRWYRTGDIVTLNEDDDYVFVGRRDRMIKKRGYRVELGEIESCLHQHPELLEAAVVAIPDDDAGMIVRAHLSTPDGGKISLIKLKKFCSEKLPVYMVPDTFTFHEVLPKTSTDKVDYQQLKNLG